MVAIQIRGDSTNCSREAVVREVEDNVDCVELSGDSGVSCDKSAGPVIFGCVWGFGGVSWDISVDPVISMWFGCSPFGRGRSIDPVISGCIGGIRRSHVEDVS